MRISSAGTLFVLFFAALTSGCPQAPAEGGTCASFGTPCYCPDGRTECAPHSTRSCPCGEVLAEPVEQRIEHRPETLPETLPETRPEAPEERMEARPELAPEDSARPQRTGEQGMPEATEMNDGIPCYDPVGGALGESPVDASERLVDPAATTPTPSTPTSTYGFDPAPFAACSSNDECAAIRQQCFTAAVHRDRRDEYVATLRGVRFRCSRPPDGGWPAIHGVCRSGQCAAVVD